MTASIRWKLALIYFVIIICALLLGNFLVLRSLQNYYVQTLERNYLTHANILTTTAVDYLLNRDHSVWYKMHNYGGTIDARILILDQNSRVVLDTFDEDWLMGKDPKLSEVKEALQGSSSIGHHEPAGIGKVMYVAVPVISNQKIKGAVLLSTATGDIFAMLNQVKQQALIVSLACSIFVALFSLWLAGALTRPLNNLTAVAQKMAGGNLHQRVDPRRSDELGRLARAFNHMSSELEKVDRSRRDFISNVSHELKSPLSSMKVLAESLIYARENDIDAYREYMQDINVQVDRLNQLINDLLHLMRIEEEGGKIKKENCLVSEITASAVEQVRKAASAKKIKIEVGTKLDDHLTWLMNPNLVTRALVNLLENGVKYTPPGGRVWVNAEILNGKELVFQVGDTGEGIPEKDIPNIFERFYRVDKARSRETGGSGLGLAIVKQIISAHGGSVSAQSGCGTGTVFTIKLPQKNNNN